MDSFSNPICECLAGSISDSTNPLKCICWVYSTDSAQKEWRKCEKKKSTKGKQIEAKKQRLKEYRIMEERGMA